MAAEQTISISTRKVIVLHTRTIPQGITALLNYDPDSDDDANATMILCSLDPYVLTTILVIITLPPDL